MSIKVTITPGDLSEGTLGVNVMAIQDGLALILSFMDATKNSENSFQVDFFVTNKPGEPNEMLTVQRYYPYGTFINYTFKKERGYSDGIGFNYIVEDTSRKKSFLNPCTEYELVYEYYYLPDERARMIIRDLYLNGMDALANYKWENEDKGPFQPGPG